MSVKVCDTDRINFSLYGQSTVNELDPKLPTASKFVLKYSK